MKSRRESCILGAGVTGLAAAMVSRFPVYEAEPAPGGICRSYYVRPGEEERLRRAPEDGAAYRFEIGGGHWIFGGDASILRFLHALTPVKSYQRRSAVYFPSEQLLVPYPLQNHLNRLGKDLAAKALQEIVNPSPRPVATQADWVLRTFGSTLTDLFFGPFHELYTAGLWTRVAPTDSYKSPVDLSVVVQGAFGETEAVGYNAEFSYPEAGLDGLVCCMSRQCKLEYSKRVVQVDLRRREIQFSDGSGVRYGLAISTLPLSKMVQLAGVEVDEEPGPSTSVLVLNIGATRGPAYPAEHWLYLPNSKSGFHRVGFYSNVDLSFLPRSGDERASIYVERAFLAGCRPDEVAVRTYAESVIQELREWDFIRDVEVVSPTWVEVAYTWSMPGSRWRSRAMELLEKHDILMTGRYGKWQFQGIADSIRDGFVAGSAARSWKVSADGQA